MMNRIVQPLPPCAPTRFSGIGGRPRVIVAVLSLMLLASCNSRAIYPTVSVSPGPTKTPAALADDRSACLRSGAQALQPIADRVNAAPRTADEINADNDRIQAQYNQAYGSCMTARGNVVLTASPTAGPLARPGSSEPVYQRDLPISTDAAADAAKRYLVRTIAGFQKGCPGAPIAVEVHEAPVSPAVTARMVILAGDCFGNRGEVGYLVARGPRGWTTLHSGLLSIMGTSHQGYRDVQMSGHGSCAIDYEWDGRRYAKRRSHDCAFEQGPAFGESG